MAPVVGALPPPPGTTPDFSQPKDVLHTVNFVTQSLCLSTVTILVFVRVYTRAVIQKIMYKEDCRYRFIRSTRPGLHLHISLGTCILSWLLFIGYITDNFLCT